MKVRTCQQLYELLKRDGFPLLSLDESEHKWIAKYNENYDTLDRFYLSFKYKNLLLDDSLSFDTDMDTQQMLDEAAFISNVFASFDEIDKIYDTLNLEYNPIWNVDGTEKEIHSGTDKHEYNSVKDTKSTHGSITDTHGGTDNNVQTGTVTNNIQKHPQVGGQSFVNTDRNSTEYDNVTNRMTYDSSNTRTYSNHGEDNTRTGSESDVHGHIIEKIKGGNIGVTSTQNLLTQEVSLRERRFFDYVFELFAKWFTSGVFDTEGGWCDWHYR